MPSSPLRLRATTAAITATAALLAANAATASAAAPWSDAAAVPDAPATAPALAFNAGGLGVIAGDTGGGESGAVGPHTVGALGNGADEFPTPMAQITSTNFALANRFALYGLGRTVGMGSHFSRKNSRAGIVFGDAGDDLPNVHFVGPTDRDGTAEAVAANDRGDVAGTFGVCNNSACRHQSVYLVVRRSGGSLQSSKRIDNDAVRNISTVAINQRGDMIVAWQADGGVFARIRTAGGTLYDTERLGNPGEPVRAISAVLGENRGAAVAWEAQDVNEGTPESPATVDASVKSAGASHHFHSSQRLGSVPTLATGQYVSGRGVKVVRSEDGRVTAAWTAFENGRFVVQAATLSATRFRPGVTLSAPAVDAILADVDAGPTSELAVAWRTGVGGTDPGEGPAGLEVAMRDPGQSVFLPTEVVEQGTGANDPVLRFDPSTGRAVVAWNDLTTIQTSVRPALVAPRS
jgi:hypothetical protein